MTRRHDAFLLLQIGNEIEAEAWPPRPLKEHIVELSLRLRGETYNDALRDPSSFQYQQLAKSFTRRVGRS